MVIRTPLHVKLIGEFVGTAALCAIGLGAVLNVGPGSPAGLLLVAFAHGLAIAIMVTATGHTSGGHLNPAVTLATIVTKQKEWLEGLWYIAAQLAGGVAGAALIKGAFGDRWVDEVASVALADGVSIGEGILLEALATFFLVFVVFAVAVDRDGAWFKIAGLPIGLTVTADILMIGPLTGGAMNPARWFAPNLLTGSWDDVAAWLIGPSLGAVLAGVLYIYVFRPRYHEPV